MDSGPWWCNNKTSNNVSAIHLPIATLASCSGFADGPPSPTTLPISWLPSANFIQLLRPVRGGQLASAPYNQRKSRKNRRRAFAAGDRNAFRR